MTEATTPGAQTSTESSAAQPSLTGVEALQSTEAATSTEAAGATEQTPEQAAATEAEAAENAKRDKAQKRINAAVRAQREAERTAETARQEAADLRKQLAAKDPEQARIQLEQAEIDRRADEKAKQLVAQRDYAAKVSAFDANGLQDSAEDWNDNCNAVAAMGASKRRDFVPILADIEHGHRAIAHLAADSDLTEKILAMPPHKMAIELAKLADKPIKEAPKKDVSKTPAPIKTVAGNNKGDGYRPNMSVEEHIKWAEKNAPYKR